MDDPDVLKLPDQGPLLEAVGRVIQTFSMLELAVGFCFASMMSGTNRGRSVVALHAVRRFEEKIKILDAVADISLSEDQLTIWRNLSARISRRADMRNKVAHWMVGYWPGASNAKELKNMKAMLVPPVWSGQHAAMMWGGGNLTKERPISKSQLDDFVNITTKLVEELFEFSNDIKTIDCNDD